MDRKTVLVGSIPAGSAEEAMTQALREVGPHLRQLPDGETAGMQRPAADVMGVMDNPLRFRESLSYPLCETSQVSDAPGR